MCDAAPNILVVGGEGFIGAAAVCALKEAGASVAAGSRRGAGTADGRDVVACNLDDAEEIRAAVKGRDLVVHAAFGDDASLGAQLSTLLEAMTQASASRLIYISSIAVYGDRDGVVDESAAPGEPLDAYARAKLDCEHRIRLWGAAAPGKRRALILRPGAVYGAGSRFWIDKMIERLDAGALPLVGDGRAPLIHVDDLAAMIAVGAQRLLAPEASEDWPAFLALNAVGAQTLSWNDYFLALAKASGRPAPQPASSARLLALAALATVAKTARRLGVRGLRGAALLPTGGERRLFSRRADYSIRACEKYLSMRPGLSLDEGLARSFHSST